MNHTVGRSVFALGIGLIVAVFAFQWITDPAPRAQRAAEEQAVTAARELLREAVGSPDIEIVDPLSPDRKVGKVYVYAESPGWAVSGYYRHEEEAPWRPYLVRMTEDLALHSTKTDGP